MDVKDAGKLGGQSTFKKLGRQHFVDMRKKSRGRLKQPILVIDKPL